MRLYRLKCKENGKYLTSGDHRDFHWCGFRYSFSPQGVFFRKIDTIRKHLIVICSEYERFSLDIPYNQRYKKLGYYPERAALYEIEYIDVTVNNTTVIEAADILKDKK